MSKYLEMISMFLGLRMKLGVGLVQGVFRGEMF